MLYWSNRPLLLIWRVLICFTFCLSLQNIITCSTTPHVAKDYTNQKASYVNSIQEQIGHVSSSNSIVSTEFDEMITVLRNVSTNIIFVTDFIFAPEQSSGGYAYSIAQPSSSLSSTLSSFTCIATTNTYLRPFTFAEFMQSFTVLHEFNCEQREGYNLQINETICSGKYELNGQYGWLNLRSSCYVLMNQASNGVTDSTLSSSCIWKFQSRAANCIEGEKEALFVVDAITGSENCPSAKASSNETSCTLETNGTNSTRYTTNVIFANYVNVHLHRRELLHDSIADGVDFVTSVLVTRTALRETLSQLETNIDTANYMDDGETYQRKVFDEWNTYFLNYYAPRMHTKWKILQQFAQETITSAEISGKLLLREYSNRQTSIINNICTSDNNNMWNVVDCPNSEICHYDKSKDKGNNSFYNTITLPTESQKSILQNNRFTCPLVDHLSLINFSLEMSLEELNASVLAEQTLQTLEQFLELIQTINLQEKAEGIWLLEGMFCFCVSHLITSIALLDQSFVTAELASRTLQPLYYTSDWLLEYLEELDVSKSLTELTEYHEHIRITKETYLSSMQTSFGVPFVDCVFNVLDASSPTSLQSTSNSTIISKEYDQLKQNDYDEAVKPLSLNTCIEPVLQAYGLVSNVSANTEIIWSFQEESAKTDIVDYANNLVQHSYHFTVNNNNNSNEDKDDKINNVTITTVSEYVRANTNEERDMTKYCDKRALNENANVYENELDECGYFSPALLFPSYNNVTFPVGYATMSSYCDDVNETCTCDVSTTDNSESNPYCVLPNFASVVKELLCEPGTYFAMNTQLCSPCKVLQLNSFDLENESNLTVKQEQRENDKTMTTMIMEKINTAVLFNTITTDDAPPLLAERINKQVTGLTAIDANVPFAEKNRVMSGAFPFCPGDGEMHQCPRLTSNKAVYEEVMQNVNRTLPRTACRYYCNHSRFAPLHNGCVSTPQYYFNTSSWHSERCVLSELIYRSGGSGVVVGSGVANAATSCPVMLREKYWSNELHSNISNEFLPFVWCQLHNSSSSSSSSCTSNEMNTMWTIQLSSINFTLLRAMHIAAAKANACVTNKEQESEEETTGHEKLENLSTPLKQEPELKPTQAKHLLASFRPKDVTDNFEQSPYWSLYLVTGHSYKQLSEVYTAYFYLETNTVYTTFSTSNSKALHTNSSTIIHTPQGSALSGKYYSVFGANGNNYDGDNNDICENNKNKLNKLNVQYNIDDEREQMYSAIKSDEWLLSENDTRETWNWSVMWESDRGKFIRFFVNDRQIGAAIPIRQRLNFLKESSESTHFMHLAFGGEVAYSMANESLQFATRDKNSFYYYYEQDNINNNNNGNGKGDGSISNGTQTIVPLPTFADFMPATIIAFTRTFNVHIPTQKLVGNSFDNIRRQREQQYNNTVHYLEKLNVSELLSYSSFNAAEMWSRSAQLIKFATSITQSMTHACRSGYGVNGQMANEFFTGSRSIAAVNNAMLCLPCPLASYTETQHTSDSTTKLDYVKVNQSLCTCIETWQWRNSSRTCILRPIGNSKPEMWLVQTTFVIPDNVTYSECLEEQRSYYSLTIHNTPSSLMESPNASYILLGWSAALMPSNTPKTYLPDISSQRIRESYECSNNIVRIDSYESISDALTNSIALYSSAASGLAQETCRIYSWVSSESTRPSKAINTTVHFAMRPNVLMPWNVNVKNITSVVYNQRVLVASISDYNMFPEFSLQSILKLQELSAKEVAIITHTLENAIVKLEVNCSDTHVTQQMQNALSKHASYKKLKMFINSIIYKRISNNMVNTTFANDITLSNFNSVYYSQGLFFISLVSADDACILTWTVRSNSSSRESNNGYSKGGDGGNDVSPFTVSHGLRLVTLPWRVRVSFQSNSAVAVNSKWITSTNNEFTISSTHLQFNITSIAHYSDLITVPFALVTFIVLLIYYRNRHASTRQILLSAKAES